MQSIAIDVGLMTSVFTPGADLRWVGKLVKIANAIQFYLI